MAEVQVKHEMAKFLYDFHNSQRAFDCKLPYVTVSDAGKSVVHIMTITMAVAVAAADSDAFIAVIFDIRCPDDVAITQMVITIYKAWKMHRSQQYTQGKNIS